MNKKFSYNIFPEISEDSFKEACKKIENSEIFVKRERYVEDVDGTQIQEYRTKNREEILVFNDYEIGAIFVDSDINLDKIL